MKVKLHSYSKPAEEFEGLETVQDLIAHAARVSNPSNQMNTETSERLLKYLAQHKHWSPFEMTSACLEIETTRDIARQILRHRSFSFQEFSQRYANPQELGDQFVIREARLQDTKIDKILFPLKICHYKWLGLKSNKKYSTLQRKHINGQLTMASQKNKQGVYYLKAIP
jgi:flavin-dependent thymidylate synthase